MKLNFLEGTRWKPAKEQHHETKLFGGNLLETPIRTTLRSWLFSREPRYPRRPPHGLAGPHPIPFNLGPFSQKHRILLGGLHGRFQFCCALKAQNRTLLETNFLSYSHTSYFFHTSSILIQGWTGLPHPATRSPTRCAWRTLSLRGTGVGKCNATLWVNKK